MLRTRHRSTAMVEAAWGGGEASCWENIVRVVGEGRRPMTLLAYTPASLLLSTKKRPQEVKTDRVERSLEFEEDLDQPLFKSVPQQRQQQSDTNVRRQPCMFR